MKFYRVDWYVSDETEQSSEWMTNKRQAERIARDNRCGDYEAIIREYEVPTDKKGLESFLNEHLDSWPGATRAYGGCGGFGDPMLDRKYDR